jgi:hypothetical protein
MPTWSNTTPRLPLRACSRGAIEVEQGESDYVNARIHRPPLVRGPPRSSPTENVRREPNTLGQRAGMSPERATPVPIQRRPIPGRGDA